MTLDTQFLTMIFMVLGGLYLGIAKDTFRRFSPYWKNKWFINYVMEICFWLTQTFLLFYVLFRINGGELRVYVFLACLLGFAMYQALASALYKKVLESIIRVFTAIYRLFAKIVRALIITPIQWTVRLLLASFLRIMQIIFTVFIFIAKCIFLPIIWFLKMVYRLLPDNMQNILHKIAGFYSIIKNICSKWMKYIKFKRR
ncbi:MAG TPA: spore cortex biosynthesis protein YabQ [Virgibacillus sp.]|nr:spore cortex biosynthesis protein YabQ [Virgibacillus sp.]